MQIWSGIWSQAGEQSIHQYTKWTIKHSTYNVTVDSGKQLAIRDNVLM